jgi:plasmid stabilization system protein ParE
MTNFQFTPQSITDLFEIWRFIAEDNPTAADRVEEAIFKACEFLANSPLAGRIRQDLTTLPLRFWVVQPYPSYLIVYNAESRPVQVIRILHAARDLPTILR